MRILHVIESWGGGVTTAVADYIAATPEFAHSLLVVPREGVDPQLTLDGLLESSHLLPEGHLARVRAVAAACRDLRPDVVHAHSSFAGFYVRASPGIDRGSVVYSPHCYGFERRDVGPLRRGVIRFAERVLARRTALVVAVSPREAALARRIRRGQPVTYVPNVLPQAVAPRQEPFPGAEGPLVVTVGRITPQKDPAFFAVAARAAAREVPGARWMWIGDGETDLRGALRDAGVTVTGWLPRHEVLRRLAEAQVYVHTAEWEGAPLSVLEAVAQDLPVAARDIPALRELGLPDLVKSPDALAADVAGLLAPNGRGLGRRKERAESYRAALAENTAPVQADRLREAYHRVALRRFGTEGQR